MRRCCSRWSCWGSDGVPAAPANLAAPGSLPAQHLDAGEALEVWPVTREHRATAVQGRGADHRIAGGDGDACGQGCHEPRMHPGRPQPEVEHRHRGEDRRDEGFAARATFGRVGAVNADQAFRGGHRRDISGNVLPPAPEARAARITLGEDQDIGVDQESHADSNSTSHRRAAPRAAGPGRSLRHAWSVPDRSESGRSRRATRTGCAPARLRSPAWFQRPSCEALDET